MTRGDALYQSLGDTTFPIDVLRVDADNTLVSLDPGTSMFTGLFRAAINAELGAAWREAIGGAHANFGTLPVADILETEPSTAVMTQRKAKFPLLCVHRDGEAVIDHVTMHTERLTQTWAVHYILGPLDVAGVRKLGGICVAIAKLICLVVRQRGHQAYDGGLPQFFEGKGGFASVWTKAVLGPGAARFEGEGDSPTYFAVTVTLETTEHTREDSDAEAPLESFELSVGVGNADQVAPDVIQTDSSTEYQPP